MKRAPEHLAFLDSIRGLAILCVFVYHCLGAYGSDQMPWAGWFPNFSAPDAFRVLFPATFGWAGVSIFFAVSGFCIHLSHQRSSAKGWPVYFTRRFFRIYPPYLFVVLLIMVCHVLLPSIEPGVPFGTSVLGSHLLLIHNWSNVWYYGINPSFWSIAVEMQLYLLYPLLLGLAQRLTWLRALWITAAVEIALRSYASLQNLHDDHSWRQIRGSPFFFWYSWSIGAYAAEAMLKGEPLPFHRVPAWVFPLATVAAESFKPTQPFAFLLASLSTISLINLCLTTPLGDRLIAVPLIGPHLAFAGTVSYSFYLIHQPLVETFRSSLPGNATGHPYPGLTFLLSLALWLPIVLISWGLYRFLELPSIALGKAVGKGFTRRTAEG